MRILLFISTLLGCYLNGNTQNKWEAPNDSCYQRIKEFYNSCTTIRSNKTISKKKLRIDKKLINLINRVYSTEDLKKDFFDKLIKKYKNGKVHLFQKDGIETMEFNANAEGNLYVSIKVVLTNGTLKSGKIYLATKTKVLCNEDVMYVNGLDFLYLYRFIHLANFPMDFKPHQSNLFF